MTEEKHIAEKRSVQTESHNTVSDTNKPRDNKKEKCRPMTKVVVRRLPPIMTQEQFVEQVSPLPEHDYLYFAKADMSLGQYAFSRAYINFVEQQDIFLFREKFDNYVFVDAKGNEYPAVVEFAPFQRLPRKRGRKTVDPKSGSIESDPYYISFLETLKNQDSESGSSQPKTEYSYQPSDNTQKKVTTTPLLDFLKQRKQEKQRMREEKREVRRRRRLKDEPTISQVLKNPDAEKESRENKEKEKIILKENKNRPKKEEKFKDKIREKEIKLQKAGKDRDKDAKHLKKQEDKKIQSRKEDSKCDDKNENKEEKHVDSKDDFREKKSEEKKGKSYEKMRQEKKRLADAKKQSSEGTSGNASKPKGDSEVDGKVSVKEVAKSENKESHVDDVANSERITNSPIRERKLVEKSVEKLNLNDEVLSKFCKEDSLLDHDKSRSNEDINKKDDCTESNAVKETKIVKRRNSLESGGDSATCDSSHLRRHKSLDGGDQDNLQKSENDKDKDKKDPRLERRIRNKDRPAMEIYRPGMGRFSKQRLEREKSTNDDRASLSESPTPGNGNSSNQKNGKSGNSEVRSMTFKRSFSRENS